MGVAYCQTFKFQDAVTTGTTPLGSILSVRGLRWVGFQVVGLNTGTVQFEATLAEDPTTTTWVAVRVTPLNTGTVATTAGADGLFVFDAAGCLAVRTQITTLSIVNNGELNVYGFAQAETS